MKGFFDLDLPTTKIKNNHAKSGGGCEACGLYNGVRSPKMPYTGKGQERIFLLGEAPGRQEDQLNEQFVGESGRLLRRTLNEFGYDLNRDFWKNNVVRCRPVDSQGNNRTPTKNEIQCCRPLWKREIEELKPKFIFLLGSKAVEAFFGDRSRPIVSDLSIGRWNRTCVPDKGAGAWVISVPHPSYVIHNADFEHKWKADLKWALDQLRRPAPTFPDWAQFVKKLTKFEDVIRCLSKIRQTKPTLAIDYETSGIRPYVGGHSIWTIGVSPIFEESNDPPIAYSFPFSYPGHWTDKELGMIRDGWNRILADAGIPKVGQNIQYEEIWSRRILRQSINNWVWDTMVCAHVLNESRLVTGLDFQVFANYGYEYGGEIAVFKSESRLGINRIHEAPLLMLLEYNGLDALFTGLLYLKQREAIYEDGK